MEEGGVGKEGEQKRGVFDAVIPGQDKDKWS